MVTKEELSKIRKKARASGAAFELKVRKDLESKGWIVAKWSNNVEPTVQIKEWMGKDYIFKAKLVPAKHKFRGPGIPMVMGTGFPDFIAFRTFVYKDQFDYEMKVNTTDAGLLKEIAGVEAKSNGYLTKEEKIKCKWLLDNHIFSKILIAKKGEKRGTIVYKEWKTE